MLVSEALENALIFLEALGYTEGGDIHDDLALAITRLKANPKSRPVMESEL